jgi:hypothetical protein
MQLSSFCFHGRVLTEEEWEPKYFTNETGLWLNYLFMNYSLLWWSNVDHERILTVDQGSDSTKGIQTEETRYAWLMNVSWLWGNDTISWMNPVFGTMICMISWMIFYFGAVICFHDIITWQWSSSFSWMNLNREVEIRLHEWILFIEQRYDFMNGF